MWKQRQRVSLSELWERKHNAVLRKHLVTSTLESESTVCSTGIPKYTKPLWHAFGSEEQKWSFILDSALWGVLLDALQHEPMGNIVFRLTVM
jgi:hypothetical protein